MGGSLAGRGLPASLLLQLLHKKDGKNNYRNRSEIFGPHGDGPLYRPLN